MFIRSLNTRIKRVRGAIQILFTVCSFLGLNKAVLATHYRNTLYTTKVELAITIDHYTMEPAWSEWVNMIEVS
ncbi:hypothetical protein ACH42_06645 [Endozoicomonas sp. (ex Bugula neritina AB1)]|nr:hypothetical protein ACH42_06645 [Endozoicomonas sp. (ex Bugula neritina AB1)]